MGGYGSGRHWSSKETTADYPQLDVRRWQREGLLAKFSSFLCEGWRVDVPPSFSTPKPEWVFLTRLDRGAEMCPVPLEWTPCNYGGLRAWFHCPTRGCGRRVAILYCDGNRGTLSCRHCLQLTYQSRQDSDKYRALHRVEGIRASLGGSPCIVDPFPEKPKGMHWRTYHRLHLKAATAEMLFLSYF